MKELYISPELELISFVPQERLAGNVDYGDDFGGGFGNNQNGGMSETYGEIVVPDLPGFGKG